MGLFALASLILVLVVVGIALWAVTQMPIPRFIAVLIQALVAIFLIVYVAGLFGIFLR